MTPSTPAMPRPKVFLSYCYTSPEFVERVDKVANDLMSDGVHVVFDRWDLREGQDLHAFMEQAVNDPTVTHVLILCDPTYAQKADNRRGGVGTETLILSPGVYKNAGQSRVVPVIMEHDEEEQVQVPTYLVGRRYIDLSSDELMAENYEQLIRHLYDRPAQPRPALGRPPVYLDEQYVPLQTASAERLARTALLGHRGDAVGRLADYLDRLAGVIASEDLTDPPGDEQALIAVVMASIERFRPYRDEFLILLRVVARYVGAQPEVYDRLHGFFERVVSMRYQHAQKRWDEAAETENLGFIGWELMLEATAVLLQEGRHVELARLLQPMYVRSRYNGGALRSADVLEPGFHLIARGNELSGGTRWAEPAAQLLRQRVEGTGLSFEAIMEADLLLWYRSVTGAERAGYWYPRTLVYAESTLEFPLFARARSTAEFARLAPALGVRDRAEFVRWFRGIEADDFFRIGRAVGGRAAYERLLGLRPDET